MLFPPPYKPNVKEQLIGLITYHSLKQIFDDHPDHRKDHWKNYRKQFIHIQS